jgi:hypothetical protein
MDDVRCSDCGFLAVRVRDTLTLISADQQLREQGRMPSGDQVEGTPICVRAVAIRSEIKDVNSDAILAVVSKQRPCDHFTQLVAGLSPQEHVHLMIAERESQRRDEQITREHKYREEEIALIQEQVRLLKGELQISRRALHVNALQLLWVIAAALAGVLLGRLSKRAEPPAAPQHPGP